MNQQALAPIKRATIEATVIRADGTVEQLGVVSDSRWRKYSPARLRANRRIRRANRRVG